MVYVPTMKNPFSPTGAAKLEESILLKLLLKNINI
jgi:hypothetical protein